MYLHLLEEKLKDGYHHKTLAAPQEPPSLNAAIRMLGAMADTFWMESN